jgi:hypothetical protein
MLETPGMPNAEAEDSASQKKFWEGPYPEEQAPLAKRVDLKAIRNRDDAIAQGEIDRYNKLAESIEKMARQLKNEGHEFELTDDESEYVLRVKGFEGVTHITKVDDPGHVDIKGIIFTRITQPERE